MIKTSARVDTTAIKRLKVDFDSRLRRLALDETHKAAFRLKTDIRGGMSDLGRLGQAIGSGSDKEKSGKVYEKGNGRWSASGWVFVRSKSERTLGAIKAYTEGANIIPRSGRWLWFATPEIHRLVGLPLPSTGGSRGKANFRLTPKLWDRTYGKTLGLLTVIKSVNGRPIMILKNPAYSSASGKRGLRGPLKSGRAPKGTVQRDFVVAFIAIPNTARAQQVDVEALAQKIHLQLPNIIGTGLKGSLTLGATK